MPGRTTEVPMPGRIIGKGAHTYQTRRVITAAEATATITIPATGITDPPTPGIRAAAMEGGARVPFPLAPTIGV